MAIKTRNVGVDVKKHKTMLTKSERKFVSKKLGNLKVGKVSPHAGLREFQRGITYSKEDFQNDINFGNLIEIQHYEDGSTRYLFRSSKTLRGTKKGDANVVFVVIAKDGEIRSCWLNNINDHHETLDKTVYDESANIFEWLKGGKRK